MQVAVADWLLVEGTPLVHVCQHLGVTRATRYRWLHQYGGMNADDGKRLRDLEKEKARLGRLVADQALDVNKLKEVNQGNFLARLAAGPHLITRWSCSIFLSAAIRTHSSRRRRSGPPPVSTMRTGSTATRHNLLVSWLISSH